MAAPVVCYWLEPTERVRLALRRYHPSSGSGHFHDARAPIGEAPIEWADDDRRVYRGALDPDAFAGDARWPTRCPCGYVFVDSDARQVFVERIYRRADTGVEIVLREAEPGAMWDAEWYPRKGADGRSLVVICPDGHHWHVDGEASNCTLPHDDEHRCWLRQGEPPRITVSKHAPGQRTCSAGAGSILTPKWHGFLRNGRFETCGDSR